MAITVIEPTDLTLSITGAQLPTKLVARKLSISSKTDYQRIVAAVTASPWSFWLDSCESDHIDSRYDILVWHPIVSLCAKDNQTTISIHDSDYHSLATTRTDDPLAAVKQMKQQIFSDIDISSIALPFKGGAVGYFSYDLGRRFERLPEIAEDDIALPEMMVGIFNQALVYDRINNEYLLIAPEQHWAEVAQHLTDLSEPLAHPFKLTSAWQSNMSKESYQHKFNQVQDYLLSGDCYQINLAQRFSAQYQGDEFQAYLTLRAANQAPFSAFMRFADHSILSISPERFLQVQQNKVQTKPIKGTLPRGKSAEQDQANAKQLAQSSKDRAENLMIVDLLRNDISRVCKPGSVKVPKLFDVESFPAVHHLVSTVEGELAPEYDGSDLLRAAFPGGSITGAPKIRAMEIIEELEPHKRNLYCGSIGYLSACGNMDTSITIRTLICQNSQIHCWAGGGLVADSKVDSEYQETFDKVAKILPILTG